MGQFSNYPAATDADYQNATTFLIQNTDGETRLASISGLNTNIFGDIQITSLTITKASVLTLNSIPVELIAAQGAGTAIEIMSVSVRNQSKFVPYATNTTLQILTSGATDAQFDSAGILLTTVSAHWKLAANEPTGATDTQLIANAAVNVSVATGDPTAGGDDIEVFAIYRVINV